VVWVGINVYLVVNEIRHPGLLKAWDPYPFILLNLVLSFQAAFTGTGCDDEPEPADGEGPAHGQHDYEITRGGGGAGGGMGSHALSRPGCLISLDDQIDV